MIKFVDLREQDIGYNFSFWDTVTDSYINVDGEFAWDDWNDLKDSGSDRLKALCPEWVFNESNR